MAKIAIIMIAPHRNARFKGGVGMSRQDMMDGTGDGSDGAGDGMDDDGDQDGGKAQATVPVSSLAADGTPPSPGDKVNFSIEGIVSGVNGGQATIDIKSVDGEAVDSYAGTGAIDDTGAMSGMAPGRGESLSQMGARLRNKAAQSSGY